MQFAAPRPVAARQQVNGRLPPPSASRQSVVPLSVTQPSAGGQPGDKLLPLLRTPFDLLALPGSVALGTLQSLPELLEKLPADVERLSQLAQDPRPMEAKQAEVLGELEDRVVGYLQKGSTTEDELLTSVSAAIPEPLREVLPEQLKDGLKPRSGPVGSDIWPSSSSSSSSNGSGSSSSSSKPLATWTITSDDEGMPLDSADLPPMTPAAVAASQTAAEVMEVNAAVAALKESLTALQSNADGSRSAMLKLNLREAQETLSRRLEQMAPAHRSVGDTAVQAAIREAETLLAEVQALSV